MTIGTELPPTSYPPLPPQPNADADHLRILSICWYILAGLQALGGCAGLVYIVIALFFGAVGFSSGRGDDAAAGGALGAMFACIGFAILIFAWGIAFLNYKVGQSLAQRKHPTLCFVMAILICPWIPLGTLLGVFTLVVLSRPSVKASFR